MKCPYSKPTPQKCFNCPYPDCINDTLISSDYEFSKGLDKVAVTDEEDKKTKARREVNKRYREKNKAKLRERDRERYTSQRKSDIQRRSKEYYIANKEELKCKASENYEKRKMVKQ